MDVDYTDVVSVVRNPEPVIQSEVSQKEKNKYSILTHICGILLKKVLLIPRSHIYYVFFKSLLLYLSYLDMQ